MKFEPPPKIANERRSSFGCRDDPAALSIVQELVAAQNGTVRVESEPGRGTTVAVSLPAVSA